MRGEFCIWLSFFAPAQDNLFLYQPSCHTIVQANDISEYRKFKPSCSMIKIGCCYGIDSKNWQQSPSFPMYYCSLFVVFLTKSIAVCFSIVQSLQTVRWIRNVTHLRNRVQISKHLLNAYLLDTILGAKDTNISKLWPPPLRISHSNRIWVWGIYS